MADPLRLHPPPGVVEELEQGVDRLGELLVEAPLVLVVLAAQPLRQALDRVAQGLGKVESGTLSRAPGIEAVLDPESHAAKEVRKGLGVRRPRSVRLWLGAHLPTLASLPTSSPGWSEGPTRRPRLLAAKSRTAATASNLGW